MNPVHNQVKNKGELQVWDQVWNQVEQPLGNKIELQVWIQVWNQLLWIQVAVENQIRTQVLEQHKLIMDSQAIWSQVNWGLGRADYEMQPLIVTYSPRIGRVEPNFVRNTRFVPTPDDWHPAYFIKQEFVRHDTHEPWPNPDPESWEEWKVNYCGAYSDGENNPYNTAAYVEGTVLRDLLPFADDLYRVKIAFWGADDTGIEMVFTVDSEDRAVETYRRWGMWLSQLAYASIYELRSIGFENA